MAGANAGGAAEVTKGRRRYFVALTGFRLGVAGGQRRRRREAHEVMLRAL